MPFKSAVSSGVATAVALARFKTRLTARASTNQLKPITPARQRCRRCQICLRFGSLVNPLTPLCHPRRILHSKLTERQFDIVQNAVVEPSVPANRRDVRLTSGLRCQDCNLLPNVLNDEPWVGHCEGRRLLSASQRRWAMHCRLFHNVPSTCAFTHAPSTLRSQSRNGAPPRWQYRPPAMATAYYPLLSPARKSEGSAAAMWECSQ